MPNYSIIKTKLSALFNWVWCTYDTVFGIVLQNLGVIIHANQ
ncbi:putative membrane protein [Moraxella catarrhalis]|uniref:Membrane protein n=1 Tax=Moraxella catarrhalis TaxID=480 RepID=A0ABY0BJI4_MORCA|nr:hypothetical protein EA1_00785 [Moraxella catarrhalis O35E]RUO15763.1 putative membrane protein [Moraxella catarrhalis]RUO16065.1 putative membrane protein [Moraxella catarrhalis]